MYASTQRSAIAPAVQRESRLFRPDSLLARNEEKPVIDVKGQVAKHGMASLITGYSFSRGTMPEHCFSYRISVYLSGKKMTG